MYKCKEIVQQKFYKSFNSGFKKFYHNIKMSKIKTFVLQWFDKHINNNKNRLKIATATAIKYSMKYISISAKYSNII